MRGFIAKIVVFGMLVALMAVIGELIVRRVPDSYSIKNHMIESRGDEVSTLILGNSHNYYGLNPAMLGDSVVSLANVSQRPEQDLALLQRYMPLMPRLRRVILGVSYFTFREQAMEQSDEAFRLAKYTVRMGLEPPSPISPFNYEIGAFDAFAGQLRSMVIPTQSNLCDSLGFGLGFTLTTRYPHWQERAAKRARGNTLPPSPERSADVMRIYSRIVELCRSRGVECVVVRTPIWHGERWLYDFSQLSECDSLMRQIGVPVFDFMADSTFVDADFYNSDHLTDTGAARLSTRLCRLLNNGYGATD